jgi:hypothetical protein
MTGPKLLRRAVVARHRRPPWLGVVLVTGVGLGLLGSALIRSGLHEPQHAFVEPVVPAPSSPRAIALPTTLPIPLPAVARAPVATARTPRPSCPPPRHDAPIVTLPDFGDSFVDRVQPAPTNAGWIAAWSTLNLYVSYDAGASFTRVLDGEDSSEAAYIEEVTFDCYGRVVVLRGEQLEIIDGTDLRRLDDLGWPLEAGAMTLIGGGPDVVVATKTLGSGIAVDARIAVSHDLGATWSRHVLVPGLGTRHSVDVRGAQASNGSIRLAITAEASDRDGDHTGRYELYDATLIGGRVEVEGPIAAPGPVALYGSIAVAIDEDGAHWRPYGGDWRPVKGLPSPAHDHDATLVPGPTPSVVSGGVMYQIGSGRVRTVRSWPATERRTSIDPAALDLAGRIWVIETHESLGCDGTSTPAILGRAPPLAARD